MGVFKDCQATMLTTQPPRLDIQFNYLFEILIGVVIRFLKSESDLFVSAEIHFEKFPNHIPLEGY